MSGHSKWATIKRQKETSDKRKGAAFTKLANNITVAARVGGGNPEANFQLRTAIEKAREASMPKDNIEKATKRGTGELEGMHVEEVTYEIMGPQGTALIVETLTDNRNRTGGDLKHLVTKFAANLGGPNSALWMFNRRGKIVLKPTDEQKKADEELELALIEAGAEDIIADGSGQTIVYTKPTETDAVRRALEAAGIGVDTTGLAWVEKESINLGADDAERFLKLYEAIDDMDDVIAIATNATTA